jgi:polyferredoxin
MRRHFGSTAFLLMGALLVWIADFVFVYVFAAVACARGFGASLVPAVTTAASLTAGVVTIWLLRRGYRAQRMSAIDEQGRFIAFVTLATGAIALVALGMLILPPMLVRACGST